MPAAGNGDICGRGSRAPVDAAGRELGSASRRRSADSRGSRGSIVGICIDLASFALNRLPQTRHVAVRVLGAGGVVGHDDGLDSHGKRALRVVGFATGPRDGALGVAGVTARPDAHLELHRGLGVVSVGVVVFENAHLLAGDGPDDAVCRPVDGVGDEVVLVVVGRDRDGGAVGALALPKVHGLQLGGRAAQKLHVDLVEIVRLQHHAADDAGARGALHGDLDLAKHDVEDAVQGRGVALLADGEGDAVVAVGRGAAAGREGVDLALGEVDVDFHAQGCVGVAGCLGGVT